MAEIPPTPRDDLEPKIESNIEVEEMTKAFPGPKQLLRNTKEEKEKGAAWVAKGLIWIFAGTLGVTLIGGFILLRYPGQSADTSNVMKEQILPLLQGVSTLASSVFSPLLAFVLGYYFGEKKQE